MIFNSGHLVPRYLLKSMGFEGVPGALSSYRRAYKLDRSACLEILYGCPNWVFGSIYLEMTRKFHPVQSPSALVIHAPEKTGSMCEKTFDIYHQDFSSWWDFWAPCFLELFHSLGPQKLVEGRFGWQRGWGMLPPGSGPTPRWERSLWVTPDPTTEGRGHGLKIYSSGTHKINQTYDIAYHIAWMV